MIALYILQLSIYISFSETVFRLFSKVYYTKYFVIYKKTQKLALYMRVSFRKGMMVAINWDHSSVLFSFFASMCIDVFKWFFLFVLRELLTLVVSHSHLHFSPPGVTDATTPIHLIFTTRNIQNVSFFKKYWLWTPIVLDQSALL